MVIKDTPLEETYRRGKFTPLGVEAAAELCAAALQKFTGNGINVIRIGLQPDDELCSPKYCGRPFSSRFWRNSEKYGG